MGGSYTINALLYTRGIKEDYDTIAVLVNIYWLFILFYDIIYLSNAIQILIGNSVFSLIEILYGYEIPIDIFLLYIKILFLF